MPTKHRQTKYSKLLPEQRLPDWVKSPIGSASKLERVQKLIRQNRLHTICEEGRCPNRSECYAAGTATFLLGGSICTRSCAFCQVEKGPPPKHVDKNEAKRVAKAIKELNLNYVVLTSVARDDLPDHGATIFTNTIFEIRELIPQINIEVLTPDFWGGSSIESQAIKMQRERLSTVLESNPVCFNHNLETVKRLQKEVRRGATYKHSLLLLKTANELAPQIPTKSGLMLGLGEEYDEVIETLKDLREVNCQQITLGQYLRPSLAHIPVQKYWHPSEFDRFAEIANDIGFSKINSGPLVRSSYHAERP